MDGQDLYALVEQYSALGVHRAGTPVDDATAAWMSEQLESRGLRVAAESVAFPQWTATSRLWLNGNEVDHVPTYYSWVGQIDTSAVDVRRADVGFGGKRVVLDNAFAEANATGAEAAVFATGDASSPLRVVNQKAELSYDLPAVLIAGRDLPQEINEVRLVMDAQMADGVTTNLIAHNAAALAPDAGPPVVLSTPLTGWFTCAGERGTGVAVLLDLVERLADVPLLVLATGGHELDYFGVRQWVPTAPPCQAVLHIGASVAVDAPSSEPSDPDAPRARTLVPTRMAKTTLSPDRATAMSEHLAAVGLQLETLTTSWTGESEVFAAMGKTDALL